MAKPKNKADPKIGVLDLAAKRLLSTIDTSYTDKELLNRRDSTIQDILNSELDLAKGVSQGSIVDFVTHISKEGAKKNGRNPDEVDGYSLFTENAGNLFGYYEELYRNRYIEVNDLKLISKFIPAIGEAVKVTLDAIVSADDISSSISRNLEFGAGLTDKEKAEVEAEIERIETEEKLLKKLKNIVYKKTLITGSHYIYHIPYSELFNEYDRLVKAGKIVNNDIVNNTIAKSANTKNDTKGFVINNESVLESVIESNLDTLDDFNKEERKEVKSVIESNFANISVFDSHVLYEAIENYSSMDVMQNMLAPYQKNFTGSGIMNDNYSADGTYDVSGNNSKNSRSSTYKMTGSYIKYIDASKIIPIRVFNDIIGYFHILDEKSTGNTKNKTPHVNQTNLLGTTSGIISSSNMADDKRNKAVKAIVDAITDGILSNFSPKFVNKFAEHKKLISDCIVAKGLINTTFNIQFIPANYISVFTINENEDGMGQSMLQDALFPAKMLFSLIVSKLLLYMNKSGNRTIAYMRKGPIDVSTANHTQRVIRMLQEGDITFSDLLSTNLSFQKFSRNGNIQLPMAKNGDRLIDFEVQEGQDVDMRTPMEEYLEKFAILGTGVPSVIMEYTDTADYARSIVTANIKFASRVASLQSDLEEPTTDLYKDLIATSNLSDDLKKKVLPSFKFKLCRPRVLTNTNMADYLSQIDSISTSIAKLHLGENDEDKKAEKVRMLFIKKISADMLPFISWGTFEEYLKEIKLNMIQDEDFDKSSDDNGMDMGDMDTDEEM